MSLSVDDLRILAHLSSHPDSSAAEIAQALDTNVCSTISALHLLVSKELATVTQQGDPRRWSISRKGTQAGTSSKADAHSTARGKSAPERPPGGSSSPGVPKRNPSASGKWRGPPIDRTRCRVCDLLLSPRDRNIMGYLRDHPESQPKKVAAALGLNDVVVKRALYDLKARGEVVVTRDGGPRRWSLKPDLPQRPDRQLTPIQERMDFPGPDIRGGRDRTAGAVRTPRAAPARVKSGRARVGRAGVVAPETVSKSAPKAPRVEPPPATPALRPASVFELPDDWRPPTVDGPRLIERLPQSLRSLIGNHVD